MTATSLVAFAAPSLGRTEIIYGLAIALIGVLGLVGGALLKNSRRSPEQKDAQTNAWGALNDRMNKLLDSLTVRVANLEKEGGEKDAKILRLDNRVAELEGEMVGLRGYITWLQARVVQLLKFITDKGDIPPDPPTPEPHG